MLTRSELARALSLEGADGWTDEVRAYVVRQLEADDDEIERLLQRIHFLQEYIETRVEQLKQRVHDLEDRI
jgi:hypothetical protein